MRLKRPRFSARLGRRRLDDEYGFECRRCLRETPTSEGSGSDSIAPHGDLCDECWCVVERAALESFEQRWTARGRDEWRRVSNVSPDLSGRRWGDVTVHDDDVEGELTMPSGYRVVKFSDGTWWNKTLAGQWKATVAPRS